MNEADLEALFADCKDWEARYKRIIELGKKLEALPEEFKTEDLKVKGCQSQVWLKADLNSEGLVTFRADSDALIVKGLVYLLVHFYSERRAEEILALQPKFIENIGLAEHLSPSRANGLMAMIKQIKYYASAFQYLSQKK